MSSIIEPEVNATLARLEEIMRASEVSGVVNYVPTLLTESEVIKAYAAKDYALLSFKFVCVVHKGKTVVHTANYRKGIGHGVTKKSHGKRVYIAAAVSLELARGRFGIFEMKQANQHEDRMHTGHHNIAEHTRASEVIASLLSDAMCAAGTFEDFCANLGYDEDSRKALETYLECQKTRNAMQRAFGKNFDAACEVASQY
ncbi:MAG: hypothetical protein ACKO0Z_13530 [Betaproteobacteria bacterium]